MNGLLVLRVIEGRNLAVKDMNGFSDPYVIIQSLDETGKVLFKDKTVIKKKTLNPHWDQKFSIEVTPAFHQLKFTVNDKDLLRSEFMGELTFSVRDVNSGIRIDDWFVLQKKKPSDKISGDIHLSIQYLDSQYLEMVNRVLNGEISSSFRKPTKVIRAFLARGVDMNEEAEYLYADVVPKLRTLCQQLSYEFQFVDPLLSLSEVPYDEIDWRNFVEDEIRNCQLSIGVHSVVLLGQKYGQVLLPGSIPENEFNKLTGVIDQGLLNMFYSKDTNVLNPVFRLRSIKAQFYTPVDHFQPSYRATYEKWKADYFRLASLLSTNAEKAVGGGDESIKYQQSILSNEVRQGLQDLNANIERVLFIMRKFSNPIPANHLNFQDPEPALNQFQNKLITSVPGNGKKSEHSVSFVGTKGIETTHNEHRNYLTTIAQFIFDNVQQSIQKDLSLLDALPPDNIFDEALEHSIFWWEKSQGFVGQEKTLAAVSEYIDSSEEHPFCVVGPSGSGKTCTITVAAHQAQEKHPKDVVIMRFIGITPQSSEISALLANINQHIARMFQKDYVPQKSFQDIVSDFREKLSFGTSEKKLILFIDSLDQLSDDNRGRELEWLPARLPPNCRLILSTLIDDIYRAYPSLKKVLKEEEFYNYLPPPTPEDSSKLLNKWLEDRGRKLTQTQHKILSTAFSKNPLPLYFKLAFDESCFWTSETECVEKSGAPYLAPDMRTIIDGMLRRAEDKHGKYLTWHSFGYVTAAKHGLSATELEDILSCDNLVLDSLFQNYVPKVVRVPPLLWLRLRRDFQHYLVERTAQGASVYMWYHRQFWEAMGDRYLRDPEVKKALHRGIAEYFNETWIKGKEFHGVIQNRYILPQPLYFVSTNTNDPSQGSRANLAAPSGRGGISGNGKTVFNLRKLTELPFQLCSAEMLAEIEITLSDLQFIHAKCASGLAFDLVREMVWGVRLQADDPNTNLQHFLRFFRNQVHLLSVYPAITFQQAANFPEAFIPTQAAKKYLAANPQNWIEWLNKPTEIDPCEVTFMTPSSARSCDFSKNGARMVSSSFDVALTARSVKLWDTSTGSELASLDAHQLGVNCVCFSEDDRYIATASDDKLAKVWDAKTALEIGTLKAHESQVTSVAFSYDTKYIATASADKTIKLWLMSNLVKPVKNFVGHKGQVSCVAFSPTSGHLCSSSEDRTLRIWSLDSGQFQELRGHNEWVKACAYSPNGRRIISGSCDNSVIIWASQTCVLIRKLEAHASWVTAVRYSGDGKYFATASKDKTIKVWEDRTGSVLISFSHSDWVRSLSFYGNQLLSASMDRSIRLWNTAYEKKTVQVETHSEEVTSVAIDRDLKHLVSVSSDKSIRVWQYQSLKLLKHIPNAHFDLISRARFSSDGKLLATCSRDKTIKIWNCTNWETVTCLRTHSDWVKEVNFSPKGDQLVSCSYDGTIRIWSTSNWETVYSKNFDARIKNCFFLESDTRLAVVNSTQSIRILEKVKGKWKELNEKSHATRFKYDPLPNSKYGIPELTSSSPSPDGKLIIAGYIDGTTQFWDVENGELLFGLPRQRFIITHASALKDGSIITLAGPHLRIFDPLKHQQAYSLVGRSDWRAVLQTEDTVLVAGTSSGSLEKLRLHQ